MEFDLNDEQIDIRDTVRHFTEQEIAPCAEMWDEEHYFPREVYSKMANLGLMGMTTPEALGGTTMSRLSA
ncbi:MAG TPA: acyl-CoA dehydrogenase family protein, partial [Ktedonobacteraceae bacterium]